MGSSLFRNLASRANEPRSASLSHFYFFFVAALLSAFKGIQILVSTVHLPSPRAVNPYRVLGRTRLIALFMGSHMRELASEGLREWLATESFLLRMPKSRTERKARDLLLMRLCSEPCRLIERPKVP
mmetsp:Transcript_12592/g.16186  ORF Transcript_12592/g.16186 Transcript_12592/m.16186 type:complete len:127 (-) Transcript_12592:7110-7490(-)